MTYTDLELGKKLYDNIKDHQRVLEHFLKSKGKERKEIIDFLTNFFTNCNNLSNESTKSKLANIACAAIITSLEDELTELNQKFEKI